MANEKLEAEGKAEKDAGRAARKVSGRANQAAGSVQEAAGKISGREDVELKGTARKKAGQVEAS